MLTGIPAACLLFAGVRGSSRGQTFFLVSAAICRWSTVVSSPAIPFATTSLYRSSRGDSLFQPCLTKRRIVTAPQHHASAFESWRSAHFPPSAAHLDRV